MFIHRMLLEYFAARYIQPPVELADHGKHRGLSPVKL
jgi:hypothetical protein